jgi:hypothetical protein
MFLSLWNALVIVFAFFSCRKVRRRRTDDEPLPPPVGNLGDVQVQVQVDVNVEKGWASIAASSL